MIRAVRSSLALILFLSLGAALAHESAPDRRVDFTIAAQPMAKALNEFATQAQVRIVFYPRTVEGLMAPELSGAFTPQDALKALLANSRLKYRFTDARTVSVSSSDQAIEQPPVSGAQVETDSTHTARDSMQIALARVEDAGEETAAGVKETQTAASRGIPEMLVRGKRSVNADIERTEDDVQPYVVFDAKDIKRSLSSNLEDFLKRQLPMNMSFSSNAQQGETAGNVSSIDLRGLGTDETLILVNGRRLPGVSQIAGDGSIGQADINGIPLSAVERVEVLPSTAAGIYGGGANGGVINIILRSDFNEIRVATSYDNSFDTDSGARRLDFTSGFNLEGGRTNVLLTGSYNDSNEMVIGDRDLLDRARALYYRPDGPSGGNYPFSNLIPLASTTNIQAVDDFNNGGTYELLLANPNGGAPIPLGTSRTFVPVGYAGVQSDGGAALIANARANPNKFSFDLPRDVQGAQAGILNAPTVSTLGMNVRRRFLPRIEGFIDLSWTRNEGHISEGSDFSEVFLCPRSVRNEDYCWTGQFDANDLPVVAFSPGNPFEVPITIVFPTPGLSFDRVFTSENRVANGGFIVRLARDWVAQAEYSWSRSRTESAEASPFVSDAGLAAVDSGALNVFRDLNIYTPDYEGLDFVLPVPNRFIGPLDNTRTGMTFRLAGPAYDLPGGPLSASFFAERRESDVAFGTLRQLAGTTVYPPRSEKVDSISMETGLPLFSRRNARRGFHALEVQASVRYDRYRVHGPETNLASLDADGNFLFANPRFINPVTRLQDPPTFRPLVFSTVDMNSTDYSVGFRYAPTRDLALRASFGTGFRPPNVAQTTTTIQPTEARNLVDPKRQPTSGPVNRESYLKYLPRGTTPPGTILQTINQIGGGGPGVKAEESESISVGTILTPRFLPGLRLSVDFTDIEKTDEITQFRFLYSNLQALVQRPTGGMSLEDQIPGLVTRAPLTAADQARGYTAGIITEYQFGLVNASRASVRSFDAQVDYTFDTGLGEFRAYALGTYLKNYITQLFSSSVPIDNAGYAYRLKWRGNTGLTLTRKAWTVDWNLQYYDSYFIYNASAVTQLPGFPPPPTPQVALEQGSHTIPSQMYHDLTAQVRLGEAFGFNQGLLANTDLTLGIRNLFNTSPPIVATYSTTVGYSWYGDPRLRRYSVSISKSFH